MELKNCPFCGGKAEFHSQIDTVPEIDENGAYVDCIDMIYHEETGCPNCNIWFYNSDDDPEEATAVRWNRRAVRSGKWVYNAPDDNIPYCSECLMPQDTECNYCPSCGVQMRCEDD